MQLKFDQLFHQALENVLEEYRRKGTEIPDDIFFKAIEDSLNEDLFDKLAGSLYESLKSVMYEYLEHERLLHSEFRSRLKQRWLKPLMLFNCFIILLEEVCTDDINGSKEIKVLEDDTSEHSLKYFTMMKLLAKQVRLAKEIVYLLEGGFADAALSRWRTAHETKIILLLFIKYANDERILNELLVRFNDAAIVEEYKEIYSYIKTATENSYYKNLEAEYKLIIEKYGEKFKYSYEWARPVFSNNKNKIYFKDLESKIRAHDETSSFYKKANYQIHSSPLGTFESLGIIEVDDMDSPPYVFGPSNLGLRIPGQLEIFTLFESITMYLNMNSSINNLVLIKTFEKFMETIIDEFEKVENDIFDEELAFNGTD